MSPRAGGLSLTALMLVVSFIFQLKLKLLANELTPLVTNPASDLPSIIRAVTGIIVSWRGAIILFLAGALFLIWLLVLTKLDLSAALPLVSVGLVINAVGSAFILGEDLSAGRAAGILLVAAGIALVLKS